MELLQGVSRPPRTPEVHSASGFISGKAGVTPNTGSPPTGPRGLGCLVLAGFLFLFLLWLTKRIKREEGKEVLLMALSEMTVQSGRRVQ